MDEDMPGCGRIDINDENEAVCPECGTPRTRFLIVQKIGDDWFQGCRPCFFKALALHGVVAGLQHLEANK